MSRLPPCPPLAPPPTAWIVFSDNTGLAWLRLLRRGFRHCFAVLHDGRQWITVDPLSSGLQVVLPTVPPDFDLPRWFRLQGHTVVAAGPVRLEARPLPWAPFTCVEACKRLLGLGAPGIFTPWQLYRHLQTPLRPAPLAAES